MQNLAMLKTIDSVKVLLKKLAAKTSGIISGKTAELNVLFTPGNHDLDAGDKFLLNVMKKNPMKTLITNVDLNKSPAVQEAMSLSDNIIKSAVYSIPDDKRDDLLHKVLLCECNNTKYGFLQSPGLCKGLEFYDNSNKKDANLTEADIQETINSIKEKVDDFKLENPKGAVVLLSHMGGRLSEIIRSNVPQINHVLNGHDHKNVQSNVGKTSINSLGKDNEMIKALNFEFDDDGNIIKATRHHILQKQQ